MKRRLITLLATAVVVVLAGMVGCEPGDVTKLAANTVAADNITKLDGSPWPFTGNTTAWSSGTAVPTGGNNGDFYLRTDTQDVYKRTGGSWSVVANIKGAVGSNGTNGTNGNTILTGTTGPTTNMGVTGDFYIQTPFFPGANWNIYGPKAGSMWGSGTSINGPAGLNGGTVLDFDGDGKADKVVLVKSDQYIGWAMYQSTAGFVWQLFGNLGDHVIPADYDGDGKTDLAVYDPTDGWMHYWSSATNSQVDFNIGGTSATLPPYGQKFPPDVSGAYGDFDGDGISDRVIYRESEHVIYVSLSASGEVGTAYDPEAGDEISAADVDGDGISELLAFRPSNGYWYSLKILPGNNTSWSQVQFGGAGDHSVLGGYRVGGAGVQSGDPFRDAIYRDAFPYFYKNWADTNGFTSQTSDGTFTPGFTAGVMTIGGSAGAYNRIFAQGMWFGYGGSTTQGRWHARLNRRSSSVDNVTMFLGLAQDPGSLSNTDPQFGFWIIDGEVWAHSSDGGTSTATDTGFNLQYQYQGVDLYMNYGASQITYYIDGVLKATHTTNRPNNRDLKPDFELWSATGQANEWWLYPFIIYQGN
jgi:hypothetical protein